MLTTIPIGDFGMILLLCYHFLWCITRLFKAYQPNFSEGFPVFKSFVLTAVAAVSFSGVANAATIDVLLGNTPGATSFSYNVAGSISPNVKLTESPIVTLGPASAIFSAGTSIGGLTLSPTGSIFGGSYLSMFGWGSTSFNLSSNGTTFGFTWGSINSYNSLKLTDSRGVNYVISGSDIFNQAPLGSPVNLTQADVSISNPFGNIVFAQLLSGDNTFEAANFSTSVAPINPPSSVVPLPGAVVLFGLGLAGLGGMSFRRRGSNQLMYSAAN